MTLFVIKKLITTVIFVITYIAYNYFFKKSYDNYLLEMESKNKLNVLIKLILILLLSLFILIIINNIEYNKYRFYISFIFFILLFRTLYDIFIFIILKFQNISQNTIKKHTNQYYTSVFMTPIYSFLICAIFSLPLQSKLIDLKEMSTQIGAVMLIVLLFDICKNIINVDIEYETYSSKDFYYKKINIINKISILLKPPYIIFIILVLVIYLLGFILVPIP